MSKHNFSKSWLAFWIGILVLVLAGLLMHCQQNKAEMYSAFFTLFSVISAIWIFFYGADDKEHTRRKAIELKTKMMIEFIHKHIQETHGKLIKGNIKYSQNEIKIFSSFILNELGKPLAEDISLSQDLIEKYLYYRYAVIDYIQELQMDELSPKQANLDKYKNDLQEKIDQIESRYKSFGQFIN